MAKKQDNLTLFPEVMGATKKLSDAQFGVLMRAAFKYRFDGARYEGDDPAVDIAFEFVSSQIDRFQEVCESKAKAARDRWAKGKGEDTDANSTDECTEKQKEKGDAPIQSNPIQSYPFPSNNVSGDIKSDKPPKRSRFSPPTKEEVQRYCTEQGYSVNPDRFVSYYKSNGWMVGKNPMQDWKATVDNWERRDNEENQKEVIDNGEDIPPDRWDARFFV